VGEIKMEKPAFSEGYETSGAPVGISVRDYFATKAMQNLVSDYSPEFVAQKAYEYADAMLREREKISIPAQ
jgi:hypothetical protein